MKTKHKIITFLLLLGLFVTPLFIPMTGCTKSSVPENELVPTTNNGEKWRIRLTEVKLQGEMNARQRSKSLVS